MGCYCIVEFYEPVICTKKTENLDTLIRLQSHKEIKPVRSIKSWNDYKRGRYYFVSMGKVFAPFDTYHLTILNMNPYCIREYENKIMTDGDEILVNERDVECYKAHLNYKEFKNIKNWKYTIAADLNMGVDTAIFKTAVINSYYPSMHNMRGELVKTDSGYVINSKESIIEFKNISIYNSNINDYEEFDESKFKSLNYRFYVYDNKLYSPIKKGLFELDSINYFELEQIKNADCNTHYYTDGKYILYLGENHVRSNTSYSTFVIKYPYGKNLIILNEETLMDEENVYTSVRAKGIQIISRMH